MTTNVSAGHALSVVQRGDGGPGGERFRDRHRDQRRREFIDAAQRIIASEGIDALTMQRVTDDLVCATGSIYRYFRTKGTLIAAIQGEALGVLRASLGKGLSHLDLMLGSQAVDAPTAALARVLAAGRFWIAAATRFPQEIELLRRLFTHPDPVLTPDEASPVIPPSLDLLLLGRELLDDAVAAGALRDGPNVERAIILLAGTTGVMLTDGLARFDTALFDGERLAEELLWDLLVAWGASRGPLTEVDALVTTLADADHLVPAV